MRLARAGQRLHPEHDRVVMRREPAVREQQPLLPLASAQRVHHLGHGVRHVIADRPAAEGQPAKHRRRLLDRPADHPPRHLGHAGKARVQLHQIEIVRRHRVELERALEAHLHARRLVVAVAGHEVVRLMRRRAAPDIDDAALRHPAPPRFGQARDDEPRPLVDTRIGHHQLGIGKGDRPVVGGRLDHLVRRPGRMDPRRRGLGRHLGKARPDLARLALPLSQ